MSDTSAQLPNDEEVLELKWLESAVGFMDTRFRIPFTEIRFGFDFLIGLIPIVGDVVTFLISGLLILVMVRHGISGRLALLMMGNIALDYLLSNVPILGDLFDIGFKANVRNIRLLRAYHSQGKHQGSVMGLILAVAFGMVLMLTLLLYISVTILSSIWNLISM
ncbi:MAG: DUF4112 domain-containing protein [Bacteroidota bacterium]